MIEFSNKYKSFIIVLAVILLAVGCNKAVPAQNQSTGNTQDTQQVQQQVPAREVFYNGLEGQDALSLLKLIIPWKPRTLAVWGRW